MLCAFDQFARSTDRAGAADGLIATGFMVTVGFRVQLGLGFGLRFKVRLPFAFVILCNQLIAQRDQSIEQNRSNAHYICTMHVSSVCNYRRGWELEPFAVEVNKYASD